MSVRLGIAPIAWSNDDLPQLGGDTPLETCLKESRAAGFSGTETGGKFPHGSGEARSHLEGAPTEARFRLVLRSPARRLRRRRRRSAWSSSSSPSRSWAPR